MGHRTTATVVAPALGLGLLLGGGLGFWRTQKAPAAPKNDKYEAALSEVRREAASDSNPLRNLRDYPRAAALLAGPEEPIVAELNRLSGKKYLSREDREWAAVLVGDLAARNPDAALRWFGEGQGFRFGDEVMDVVVATCIPVPTEYAELADLAGSLPLFYRTGFLMRVTRAFPDPAAGAAFIQAIPREVSQAMARQNRDAFFGLVSASPEKGVEIIKWINPESNGGSLMASYLRYLVANGPAKNLAIVESESAGLGTNYLISLVDELLKKGDMKDGLAAALRMTGRIANGKLREERLAQLAGRVFASGGTLADFRESVAGMSDADRNSALLGFVVASGESSFETGLANLQLLGSSVEVARALDDMFSRQARADPAKSLAAAEQLEGLSDREVATKAVIKSWAGKEPESALRAALASGSVDRGFLVESWVDGVKSAPAATPSGTEVTRLFTSVATSYSSEEQGLIAAALRKKLTKEEMQQLPEPVRLYIANH